MNHTPKTEAELVEEAADIDASADSRGYHDRYHAFKRGVAWRAANPIEVDDHEQFKKDLDDHHRTWGSAHDRHFTDGWKKCRNYKFKLNLKLRDANPLPHPDTVRLEWMVKNEEVVRWGNGSFYLWSRRHEVAEYQTAREAINAAMKEEKK